MAALVAAAAAVTWLAAAPVSGAESSVPAAAADGPAVAGLAPGRRSRMFPGDLLYAPYLADPRQTGFGVSVIAIDEVAVPESGSVRFVLRLGGRFGIVRFRGPGGHPWQLDAEAGFHGQFDIENQQDNLGWDGVYGAQLSADLGDGWTARTGLHHTSSHVGDEYAERTGHRRLGYTREELRAGLTRHLPGAWRLYGEVGWGYDLRTPGLQEPLRLQAGAEVERPLSAGARRWRWYAAADLTAFEEHDWHPGTTVHLGLSVPADERSWRFVVGWSEGRVPIGELSPHREGQALVGIRLDL